MLIFKTTLCRQRSQSAKNLHEQLYGSLPRSMRSEVLVSSKEQEPTEELRRRRRAVASRSVGDLSRIRTLSEFPVPGALRRALTPRGRRDSSSGAAGGGSKATSTSDVSSSAKEAGIYGTLPKALTTQEVLVRCRTEDPEVLRERRALTQSKSVSELAKITSITDLPVPRHIERLLAGRKKKTGADDEGDGGGSRPLSRASVKESLYSTLPKSMRAEVLVRTVTEDPELLGERQRAVQSKSIGELARVAGPGDFPLPDNVESFFQGKWMRGRKDRERAESPKSDAGDRGGDRGGIYGTLPRGLTQELHVKSKVSEDEERIRQRMELVGGKSPTELGQIRSFGEIPVPRMVETWISSGGEGGRK